MKVTLTSARRTPVQTSKDYDCEGWFAESTDPKKLQASPHVTRMSFEPRTLFESLELLRRRPGRLHCSKALVLLAPQNSSSASHDLTPESSLVFVLGGTQVKLEVSLPPRPRTWARRDNYKSAGRN